jgi:hypothetical protein
MICAICTIEFAIEFDIGRCDLAGSPTPWLLQASGKRMLEGIIRSSLEIVTRAERLIENARRLLASGSLDDIEAYQMHLEVERLTDVVFVVHEAARLVQRRIEQHAEIARRVFIQATLH